MFFAEEENTAGTASAGPTVAADADPGARNDGRGGSRGVGGGFQRRPRTEQEEAEEENYKNAQNFDEYAKSVKRSCKLTLANLIGPEEPAAGPEEAEETVGEGCDEEEYYQEGEEGEYEEGEEYYYEEEAAPLPELDGMPALRSRKDRALEELDDWWKEGSLGVEYENTRVWNKRSADVFDPTVDSEHDKLKRDLTVGRSGSAVSARGGRDGKRGSSPRTGARRSCAPRRWSKMWMRFSTFPSLRAAMHCTCRRCGATALCGGTFPKRDALR